ncbi:MAG: ABC transporter substrate-binding protein [Candidatus Tectomicrobia bacterium]|nr:ABC transporter substrate-binding protein [Candidatus Tectomicrobia bacterium]
MKALLRVITLAALAMGAAVMLTSCGSDKAAVEEEPLTIGYLGALTGGFAETAEEIGNMIALAVDQVNEAGGVGGRDVRLVVGDTALDAEQGVEEARRLIEEEGAAAIVGPLASSVTLPVAEQVAANLQVPFISPSATSPALSEAKDADFLFRSTLSDAAQGAVLADLVLDDGVTSVGVLYIDDPYGRGLFEAFEDAYTPEGIVAGVSHADAQTAAQYAEDLESVKVAEADTLIAMSFPNQAQIYLQEALDDALFDSFYFVDGTKSLDLIGALPVLDGSKGTGPPVIPIPLLSLRDDFMARHGRAPKPLPFLAEAYDAAVALMLAAEAAGSTDGAVIRDALRGVASPEGEVIEAGTDSLTRGFELVRQGTPINYEGVATSLDWDANGDVLGGSISIWQYEDGDIVELEVVPVDLGLAGDNDHDPGDNAP